MDQEPALRPDFCTLYRNFWPMFYTCARRRGIESDEARDAVQAFFVRMLEYPNWACIPAHESGARSWFFASFRHFLSNYLVSRHAKKRGGHTHLRSLDEAGNDYARQVQAAPLSSPERCYALRQAIKVADRALARLEREYEAEGRRTHFEALSPFLFDVEETLSYAELGVRLGMTDGAVKVAVHRFRTRYRETLEVECEGKGATRATAKEGLINLLSLLTEVN